MASNAELQAQVEQLTADNEAWAEENEELKARLANADQPAAKPVPAEPSFRLTEGTRDELERLGRAISPFTGARLIGTPESYREVSAEEFEKHAKEHPAA